LCSILLIPPLDADELHLAVACVALGARAPWCGSVRAARSQVAERLDARRQESRGLLAEVVKTAEGLAVVVGIGVNLTTSASSDARATNIFTEAGVTITPRALLDILLEEVEWRRRALENEQARLVCAKSTKVPRDLDRPCGSRPRTTRRLAKRSG